LPRWLIYALASTLMWGIWAFVVKIDSGRLNPAQLQVLFVVGMFPLLLAALARNRWRVDKDRLGIFYGVLNGVLATVGMLAFYAAMAKGKASVVGPLTALFPLFTVAGAVALLHERLNRVQVAGVVVALAAIAVFAQ